MKRPDFVPKGWKKTTAGAAEVGVECWARINDDAAGWWEHGHIGKHISPHTGSIPIGVYYAQKENAVYYNPKTTAAAKERARFSVRCKAKNCPLGADVLIRETVPGYGNIKGKIEYNERYGGLFIMWEAAGNIKHFSPIVKDYFVYFDPNSVPTLKQNDESIQGF